MEIRIERRDRICLVGMEFYGNPFSTASAWDADNEIGGLWSRFYNFLSASPSAILDRVDAGQTGYELHILSPETSKTGRYEVFVGVETLSVSRIPVVCCAKILPPTKYAVVTAAGAEIESDWMADLYSKRIPELGYKADETYSFEFYDSRFKGMDRLDESEVDFYIPLLCQEE